MPLTQKPFTRTRLEEEKAQNKRQLISVSLNESERKLLDDIKKSLNVPSDSTALKEMAWVGWNVIQHTFSPEVLKWLTSAERIRLHEIKKKGINL
ncbi:hypothetical protein HYT53_03520 [Candidatus Woesearchaeota archaeon]|nr:hypothetical protein [Candidatus Woesearchaeota archaeon]